MVALFLISVFAGLGRWQIDRMFEKQEIEEQYQLRVRQDAQMLPSLIDDLESRRYQKVRVSGVWMAGKLFLLDNQVRDKRVGYNVLTPFMLDDERIILIDRGWVPLVDGKRDRLPNVEFTTMDTAQVVEGQFYIPFNGNTSADKKWFATGAWPALILHIDFDVVEAMLGVAIERFIVRMSPTQKDGYFREWPVVSFSSDKHLGYAVQWFALSLTVLVLLIVLNTERRR